MLGLKLNHVSKRGHWMLCNWSLSSHNKTNTTVKHLVLVAVNPKIQMFLISSCSCLCSIHWSQVLSREWRCSWSSADRRCSNYIWVIDNFIVYEGATYIRGFTVYACSICIIRCLHNALNYLPNPHKRHYIARPCGRVMGCLLWVKSLIYILP